MLPRYHWPVTLAYGSRPWCKAAALRPVLERCRAEVVVIADADVWCSGLAEAVANVTRGAPWAIPHQQVRRLSEDATAAVIAGADPEGQELAQKPYVGVEGGGYVVAHRETLLEIPMDPRFISWGQEDEAWAAALRCLAGVPWRGSATLWHLYHPPQERLDRRRGSVENWRLRRRYLQARHDPALMRALLNEVSDVAPPTTEQALHDHPAHQLG